MNQDKPSVEALPITRAATGLAVMMERKVRSFSRFHKYTMGSRLRETATSVVLLVGRAYRRGPDRNDILGTLCEAVEELRLLVNLGKEVQAFQSFDQYARVMEQVVSVARKKAIAAPARPAVEPDRAPEPTGREGGAWKRGAGNWALYGGLGVLAGGVTFAALASSAGSDVRARHDRCVASGVAGDCPAQADVDAAYLKSTLGNVGIYGGATLSLLGAYWLLTAPSDEKPRALELRVGPSSIGVGGQF